MARVQVDLLAQAGDTLHHIEVQSKPDPRLPERMLLYRMRIRDELITGRNRPACAKGIRQYILLLGAGDQAGDFDDGQATFGAPVFNVRDMNPNTLLADPSTAPLAALGKATSD
ncbi:hypothetical protein, partial [Actinoplanes sp. NBRC 101535]|uniref:hypothetical protein n=1 Tax=Actinoplanes sp. NBRC 101535 TaxID=3032196 RepID=UPI002553EEFC